MFGLSFPRMVLVLARGARAEAGMEPCPVRPLGPLAAAPPITPFRQRRCLFRATPQAAAKAHRHVILAATDREGPAFEGRCYLTLDQPRRGVVLVEVALDDLQVA